MTDVGNVHQGFVEEPGSVHKRHECPPDRVAMLARLEEIEGSYNARLRNQANVIQNLGERINELTAEKYAALERLHAWQEFGEVLANTVWHQLSPMDLKRQAQSLLSKEKQA